jgi:hypothetical protein
MGFFTSLEENAFYSPSDTLVDFERIFPIITPSIKACEEVGAQTHFFFF